MPFSNILEKPDLHQDQVCTEQPDPEHGPDPQPWLFDKKL